LEIVNDPQLTGVETSHTILISGHIPAFGDGGGTHFRLGCFCSSKSTKEAKNLVNPVSWQRRMDLNHE